MIVATITCGICIAVCSFCSPFGYRGRYTQRRNKDSHKYRADRGKLSYHNAGWFSIASLMKLASKTINGALYMTVRHSFYRQYLVDFETEFVGYTKCMSNHNLTVCREIDRLICTALLN